MPSHPHSTHQEVAAERSAETRARILDAALKEFGANGLAGARTEQIAAAAGVNKALLYYYFESKEKLYLAAFEMAAGQVRDQSLAVLQREASPGERVVRTALGHFDRLMTQRQFQKPDAAGDDASAPRRRGRAAAAGEERARAAARDVRELVREGIASGELIDVDWLQIPLVAMGANVFYFLSAPVWRLAMAPFEPFAQDALRARRVALVQFLGQALFIDRQRGAEISRRVLADTPMPEADASIRRFEGKAK